MLAKCVRKICRFIYIDIYISIYKYIFREQENAFSLNTQQRFFDDFITRINAKPCTSVMRRSLSFDVPFARNHLTFRYFI